MCERREEDRQPEEEKRTTSHASVILYDKC